MNQEQLIYISSKLEPLLITRNAALKAPLDLGLSSVWFCWSLTPYVPNLTIVLEIVLQGLAKPHVWACELESFVISDLKESLQKLEQKAFRANIWTEEVTLQERKQIQRYKKLLREPSEVAEVMAGLILLEGV